jgi:hypothetical protein
MGTRHLVGFTVDGETKAMYGQFDGYPGFVGLKVLSFCKGLGGSLGEVADKVRALRVVEESDEPSSDEAKKLSEFSNDSVSSGNDWYATLRNCQGDPQMILDAGYILNSFPFGYDGLFCEWAYVVDLDFQTLDVYRGFFRDRSPLNGLWDDGPVSPDGYLPVQKIASYSLKDLPLNRTFEELDLIEY